MDHLGPGNHHKHNIGGQPLGKRRLLQATGTRVVKYEFVKSRDQAARLEAFRLAEVVSLPGQPAHSEAIKPFHPGTCRSTFARLSSGDARRRDAQKGTGSIVPKI